LKSTNPHFGLLDTGNMINGSEYHQRCHVDLLAVFSTGGLLQASAVLNKQQTAGRHLFGVSLFVRQKHCDLFETFRNLVSLPMAFDALKESVKRQSNVPCLAD
jgi:hypothetical protein